MRVVESSVSIRRKVSVVMALTTLSALIVSSSLLLFYDLRNYRKTWMNDLQTQALFLSGATRAALQFDDPSTARRILSNLQYRPQILEAAIYEPHGAVFATFIREGVDSTVPELPGAPGIRVEGDSLVAFERIIVDQEILGEAYVRASYQIRQRLQDYLLIVGAVAVLALLLALLVSVRLQAMITEPILAVASVAKQTIASGQYSLRAVKTSQDEVGALVDDFNEMLAMIEQRSSELQRSNTELAREVAERERAEAQIRQLNAVLEQRVEERTTQLESANRELESFCYSISHDLRTPLRAIDGFSQALIESMPSELPEEAESHFGRIRAATVRMGQMIEDLLSLSKVSRGEVAFEMTDFTRLAEEIVGDLRRAAPNREVDVSIWEGMEGKGDERLLRLALENLLGNAWKFTLRTEHPKIEVGVIREGDHCIYYVRDNGAGFDAAYVDRMFSPFQRLHSAADYPGTGIGLATVQRIVHRHGGRVWADGAPGKGAVFYFTLS